MTGSDARARQATRIRGKDKKRVVGIEGLILVEPSRSFLGHQPLIIGELNSFRFITGKGAEKILECIPGAAHQIRWSEDSNMVEEKDMAEFMWNDILWNFWKKRNIRSKECVSLLVDCSDHDSIRRLG